MMNEFSIGATILKLRKGKCVTQEQLASMIGISAGAVSKWETGNSTPDIGILAPLVRALDTTLNELLSFEKELLATEIKQIKNELTEIFLYRGFTEGETKCKEYLNQYPNSIGLKFNIAGLIRMYSMLLGDDLDELINEKKQYALSLLYQVIESKDTKYAHYALFVIADIQMSLENYDESEKYLKELSNSFIDPMVLYASLLQKQNKNKEAESLCKGMLLQYLNQSTTMVAILAKISKHDHHFDKSVLYYDAIYKIQSTFKIGLCSGAYMLCRIYIEEGKKDIAAQWFENYVDGLISTEYDYGNNPYFENLQLEINAEGQSTIRKKLFQTLLDEPDLKVLVGISEYVHAIEKLETAILAL